METKYKYKNASELASIIDKRNDANNKELKELFKDKGLLAKETIEALPKIKIGDIMIKEYQMVYSWQKEGYKKFVFKGSRGSAKTTFAVQYIIFDMLLNNQSSWFVIMEKKVQHSDTTMLEFQRWITIIEEIWPGFSNKWEKVDGQSVKEWRFRHNGNFQKIKFIGLEEAGKGTITPPPNNYWAGFWVEEVQASSEQFGANMTKKAEKFNVLETLKASSTRFFSVAGKEKEKTLRLLEIWTFNPYNGEDPALENFNLYHPDNESFLKKTGFDFHKEKDLREVYITSNYLVNPYLPPAFIEFMEETIKRKIGAWKTIGLGITGSPINTVYSDIMGFIKNQQTNYLPYKEIDFVGFTGFMIQIDVGGGGKGETAIGLMGRNLKGTWINLEEWGSHTLEYEEGFDVKKIVFKLWEVIKGWEDKYYDIRKMKNPILIVMDNDPHFKVLFEDAFNNLNRKWLAKYRTKLFIEKYLKSYKNERRPAIIKYLITSGYLEIYKSFTPITYQQLKATKFTEAGKIMDGYDDHRQRMEIGAYFIALDCAKKEALNKKLFDKDLIQLIRDIN